MLHRIMGIDECGTEVCIKNGVTERNLNQKLLNACERHPEYRAVWSEIDEPAQPYDDWEDF